MTGAPDLRGTDLRGTRFNTGATNLGGTRVNADQYVPRYGGCRDCTLDLAVTDRAPALIACIDVTDVNAIVARIAPHVLERARRPRG